MTLPTMIRSTRVTITVEVHMVGIHKVGQVMLSIGQMVVCAYLSLCGLSRCWQVTFIGHDVSQVFKVSGSNIHSES
jgi:hypothetical protein